MKCPLWSIYQNFAQEFIRDALITEISRQEQEEKDK